MRKLVGFCFLHIMKIIVIEDKTASCFSIITMFRYIIFRILLLYQLILIYCYFFFCSFAVNMFDIEEKINCKTVTPCTITFHSAKYLSSVPEIGCEIRVDILHSQKKPETCHENSVNGNSGFAIFFFNHRSPLYKVSYHSPVDVNAKE